MAGWEADYPDVSGNIQPLLEGSNAGEGGANAAAYANDQVDGLIAQQSVLSDESARNALLFQALDIVNNDVPYVFLDYPVKQATINAKYTGFTMRRFEPLLNQFVPSFCSLLNASFFKACRKSRLLLPRQALVYAAHIG